MIAVEWTSRSFLVLETLPQETAFNIIRRVDLLSKFPEMGVLLKSRHLSVNDCRQLIINRNFRVIYDFDETESCIYILAIQNCRQRLPSPRDLKRDEMR